MVFSHPLMLFGMLGCALPVFIHLLLRPRPRRVRFPAAALLHRSLAAGQRAHRLSRMWLLLLRMLLISALVWILAGPTRSISEAVHANDPHTTVIVLDDSWSTNYRTLADRTIADVLLDAVRARVEAARYRPPGSTIGFVRASTPDDLFWPTEDHSLVLDALNRAPSGVSAATLRGAIEAALRALASSRPGSRELVIFTDGLAHAWRDGAGSGAGIDNLSIELTYPRLSRTNLALAALITPSRVHPVDAPLAIRAVVSSERLEATVMLTTLRGDETLATAGPIDIPAGGEREVELLISGLPLGAHGLRVELSPADRLDEDQRRYIALEIGRRPRAGLLIEDESTSSLTQRIVRNMLAPAGLSPDRQRLEFHTWTPAAIAAAEPGVARPDLLVALPLSELSNAARNRLREWVEQGTQLLLIPDAAERQPDWPGMRRWVAARAPRVETLDSPVRMRREVGAVRDEADGMQELERSEVRRRLRLIELEAGAERIVDFTDGEPAVIAARVGRGRILLLATAPDPSWSDLGIYAAGLITWLHELAQHESSPSPVADAEESPSGRIAENITVGQASRIRRDADQFRNADGERIADRIAREAGLFEHVSGGRVVALTAANWPSEESDEREMTAEEIAERMGISPESVMISDPRDGIGPVATSESQFLSFAMRGAAPLGLLLLLLMESAWSRPSRDASTSVSQ